MTRLERLRRRKVPDWFHDAKLGIFVHWSVPSVPGFAPRELEINQLLRERYFDLLPLSPYSEWYQNAIRFPWSPSAVHHREVHGDRPYFDFAQIFVDGLDHWDPEAWAHEFARSGARYVVMVTKHHDGFCLWPSAVANPNRADWHTPRDCVGELARAVRARGLRFGVYYSGGIDWTFAPRPVRTMLEFVASMPRGAYPDYAEAQVRELIERVRPDVLWNDIAWPCSEDRLLRLFEDYYAAVPEGVVNDRWITPSFWLRALRVPPVRRVLDHLLARAVRREGADLTPPASVHFDARTPEYAVFPEIRDEKWESVRGIDKSFGFNRASLPEDFLSQRDLLESFADLVSKNGNLLLNVGPRGEDGVIPDVQLERLRWLGAWLDRHGSAIYGSRPWDRAEGRTACGIPLRFTRDGRGSLHVLLLGTPPEGTITLEDLPVADGAALSLHGGERLAWRREAGGVKVELGKLPEAPVHGFAIAPLRGGES